MAPMSTSHDCPGGCGRRVRRKFFACRSCWLRLPGRLRLGINQTYHQQATTAHSVAMQNAADWYRANPPLHPRQRVGDP